MSRNQMTTPPVEAEIRSVLTRYLPIGLEGVADAQARATMDVLGRRTLLTGDDDGQRRDGTRLLRQIALTHRASRRTAAGATWCGVCPPPGVNEATTWPCPVWQAASLMGLVRD